MRKIIIAVFSIMTCLPAAGRGIPPVSSDPFRLVLDSLYIYKYDPAGQDWNLSTINYYFSSSSAADSIIFCDANRYPLSKVIYTKNSGGLIIEAHSYLFVSGLWANSEHQVFIYDDDSMLVQRTVTRWTSGQWLNLNRFSYYYNDKDLLRSYYREIWKNNNWLHYSVDTLIYDESDRLTERTATLASNGNFILRTLTSYDPFGRRASRLRQDYLSENWTNVLLDRYSYDECGNEIETITQRWNGTEWGNDTKSVPSFHTEIIETSGRKKIPVCHNGQTLYVPVSAFRAHLRHGDCAGECTTEKNPGRERPECSPMKDNPPFMIFPNPAREKVTVRFEDNDNMEVRQVQLTDFYGKPLRTFKFSGPGDLTIDRGGLLSGKYYIRLIGKDIFSTMVIFE